MRPADHAYNIRLDGPVEPAQPLDAVERALSGLLEIHDALRTRLLPGPDGTLRQVLDGSGTTTLHLRECSPRETAATGEALAAELWRQSFDYAAQWPVRFGAVLAEGRVRHVVAVFSHTAIDAWGLPRIRADLAALAEGRSPAEIRTAARAVQPMEQAAGQNSERGRRLDTAARRHWRATAVDAAVPDRPVPADAFAEGPRYRRAHLVSPALPGALARICAAHGTTSANVLLAAVSRELAAWAGTGRCGLQLMVNNRFLPGHAQATGPLAMEGYFAVRTDPAEDFTALLERTWRAAMTTYRSAYYDKRTLTADLAEFADHPGVAFERSCWYNDQRTSTPADPAAGTGTAPRPSTLHWEDATDHGGGVAYALHAADVPGGAIEVAMTADRRLLAAADIEQILHGVERTVLAAAAAAAGA
nr:condensation domain-containing protein [Kitasatospora sp. SID7827]